MPWVENARAYKVTEKVILEIISEVISEVISEIILEVILEMPNFHEFETYGLLKTEKQVRWARWIK